MKLPSTRLIEHLEQQLKDERILHKEELEMHLAVEKRLAEMHATELSRVLAENKRLQDQCERLTLRVGLPSTVAELPEEPQAPADPDAPPVFTGTTWQKVQQREQWMRSPEGKRWMLKSLGSVSVIESGETTVKEKEIH